ncbi:tyrosine-type recombinase/integrase [Wenyingzhuangia marina]|uniref:Tyrosine recombinase XerC n=1 Tax=Wenyingzhuangia marina TaxID=1195760 RepID=A0A1M5VW04_9FLAO|nr:tyrosine-type recombinase/integrase [Wenyingzhuangia marina]GGF77540.1 integrase [Wenyingzhuangia marina]SHH79370.1 integrase/recombinase XerC [Wenyingzhuangia marina]
MELIHKFLEYLSLEKNYSPHTITAYQKDLLDFFAFIESEYQEIDPCAVEYSYVRSWIISLNASGIVNRSVNRKLTALKSFYNYLQKIEMMAKNPLSSQKSLKTAKKVIIPFSEREIEESLLVTDERDTPFEQLRNKLMIHLLYATGIRQAELMSMKVQDIDFELGTIKVVGKRNKERIIPLYTEVLKELKSYIKQRAGMDVDTLYLFVTKRGGKMYGALVYRIINSYFSKVSTKEKKSPHVLRHSYATDLINQGADLNSVKELLGHSSLAATQVYTHNSLDKLKQVYNQAHPRSAKKK